MKERKKGAVNPAVAVAVAAADGVEKRGRQRPNERREVAPSRARKRFPVPTGTIPKRPCPMFLQPVRPGAKSARLVAKGRGKVSPGVSRVAIAVMLAAPPAVVKRVPGRRLPEKPVRARRVPRGRVANRGTKRPPGGRNVPNAPSGSNARLSVPWRKTKSTKWPTRVATAAVAGAVVAVLAPKTGTTPTSNRSKTALALTPPSRKRPMKRKPLGPASIWPTFRLGKKPFPTC
jgi:hypothetical protein